MASPLKLVPAPPIYQMQIKSGDDPEVTGTGEVRVEEGSPLFIQCHVDEEFAHETLVLQRNNKKIDKVKREKRSVAIHIPSYEEASHSGLYLCESKISNGTIYSRQLRLSGKSVIPADYPSCTGDDVEMCGRHGVCAKQFDAPVCFCDPGYDGKYCESHLVTDITSMLRRNDSDLQAIEVGAGVSGTLNVASIVLSIIFAILFFRQRRCYREMISYYGPLPSRNEFGELPKNPYVAVCEHEEHREKNGIKVEKVDETGMMNGINKFRKAIRTRLPGTSDSKLLEGGLDIP